MNGVIVEIVNRALAGALPQRDELAKLFSVAPTSAEAYYIIWAARALSRQASGGLAEVHAQVGLNAGPCPKNCAFCSFAAQNKIFREHSLIPVDEVIAKCLESETAGANAIYLMATATLPFADFLQIGTAVRAHLHKDTVLVANTADLQPEQAVQLRQAGFNGIYHALRLGEGIVTGISPADRVKTMAAARQAGLAVGTCVEPVGPEHTVEELVEATLLAREQQPVFSGAARRIPIPTTELASLGSVSEAKMALNLAVVRLGTGLEVPGNCTHEPNVLGAFAGANLLWAETGSNPRDTHRDTAAHRGFDVARCRQILQEADWEVLDGPSRFFTGGNHE